MDNSELLAVVLGALATTYVTCVVLYLDGPFCLVQRARTCLSDWSPCFLGKLLDCAWCTGFYVALALGVAWGAVRGWAWYEVGLVVLAWAAVAGLLLEQESEGLDGALDE